VTGKPAAPDNEPVANPNSAQDSPEPDPFNALPVERRLNEKNDEPLP
jgi:hypothetical protein